MDSRPTLTVITTADLPPRPVAPKPKHVPPGDYHTKDGTPARVVRRIVAYDQTGAPFWLLNGAIYCDRHEAWEITYWDLYGQGQPVDELNIEVEL